MINKNINRILTGLIFIISLTIYIITMAPTTSFWDCGEFISTSYILGVPHPPGSPLYLLIGNVFSSFPFFTDIGARINLISPIVSAFSVMFLYLICVYLIEEYNGVTDKFSDSLIVYGSAFIGALTFAVTDSHWFNAVEAEVYSLSTFFTSIVVWMILKWNRYNKDDWNIKYLLIIIYMFGLAIGVHLLNLLTIPFVFLIIYFKKFNFSLRSLLLVIFLTMLSFVSIYIGIIKGIPDITSKIGNTYFMLFFLIVVIVSIIILQLSNTNNKFKSFSYILSAITCFCCLSLIISALFLKDIKQLSVYKQNILLDIQELIDEYDKEIYKLNNLYQDDPIYQNRTQQELINSKINSRNNLVDEFRVLYEDYFNFEKVKNQLSLLDLLKWQPKLNLFIILIIFTLFFLFMVKFTNKNDFLTYSMFKILFCSVLLILIGYSTYFTIFIRAGQHPAINENNPDNIDRALAYMNRDQYGDWEILNWASTISRPENTNWKRYTYDKNNPTIGEKFNFFFSYQINEMYLRYFAWQFIGRGDKNEFPWYIKDLNGSLIGNQQLDGINWFRYGIPLAFIFGLFGLYMHFNNDWKRAFSVLSLFLITGFMIIIYLNQYDPQPRERDYSYVGSFFAFSIWIGIGISSLLYKIKNKVQNPQVFNYISILILTVIFLFMPVKMFATDYFQHSRKGNYVAWDYGYNLLNSCEPNGIIFTNGDNDTFPLWYLQEVENIRKDVNVVNLSLLNTPWYIEQLIDQNPNLDLDFNEFSFKDDIYLIDPYLATESTFHICNQEYNDDIWHNLECAINIENQTINVNLFPTLIKKLLRVQDFMILKLYKI